ncbi:MAG TPA: hypothetical protein VGE50_00815 [Gammaproteobacteria bacterium]
MSIEKLQIELAELETTLARIPTASANADDKSARGIYEHLIAETRMHLVRLGGPALDVAPAR